nr:hypothetical protein [Paramyrothecium roridum]
MANMNQNMNRVNGLGIRSDTAERPPTGHQGLWIGAVFFALSNQRPRGGGSSMTATLPAAPRRNSDLDLLRLFSLLLEANTMFDKPTMELGEMATSPKDVFPSGPPEQLGELRHDNQMTARAIAIECGIIDEADSAYTGNEFEFRMLNDTALESMIPRLQVLGRASQEDKAALVQKLKQLGNTIDMPDAIGEPNSGKTMSTFPMGPAGLEVAKEASSVVLHDDNFGSIITALEWGRAVQKCVRRFLRLQSAVNSIAAIATLIPLFVNAEAHQLSLAFLFLYMATAGVLACFTTPAVEEQHATTSLISSPSRYGSGRPIRKPLFAGAMLTYCMPLVSALVLVASPALRVGSGVSAATSAITLIPLRTVPSVPAASWIVFYILWLACISLYLWMQLHQIPHEARHRRKFFLFCTLLATIHFCLGVSAQSSILDGFTIFGPIIATVSVFLMSLMFANSGQEAGSSMGTAVLDPAQAASSAWGLCGM